MDAKRPKRRRDKYNPYVLFEKDGGYFISFADSHGDLQIIEIDEELFALFDSFELEDLKQMNAFDRHIEHAILTEEILNERALYIDPTVEDTVTENLEYEKLHQAISDLPEVQQRRLVLYFFGNLNYEEIAALEGASRQSVTRSIDAAIKKIKLIFA